MSDSYNGWREHTIPIKTTIFDMVHCIFFTDSDVHESRAYNILLHEAEEEEVSARKQELSLRKFQNVCDCEIVFHGRLVLT